MPRALDRLVVPAALWLVVVAVALFSRPLLPLDETRYLAVAWEMHRTGNWLVPHLNGEAYSHKPPLFFWLINLGWLAFGVSETWARLVQPLFGLATLALTALLARRLWPDEADAAAATYAPLILAGSALWMLFSTLAFFDTMMAFWAVAGIAGLVEAWRGRPLRGFGLLGLAIGLGVLSKGPAILVHLLPAALLAPLWTKGPGPGEGGGAAPPRWPAWYAGVVAGIAMGAAIALAWALPAAKAGGEAYGNAILWGQTAGRVAESFAHRQPFWWYLPILPFLLFPWLLWMPTVRAMVGLRRGIDPGLRLCLVWMLGGLLIFSAVSGKQPHYLLPEFPAFALFLARALARRDRPLGRVDRILPAVVPLLLGLAVMIGPALLARRPALVERLALPTWSLAVYEVIGLLLVAVAVLVLLLPRFRQPRQELALLVLLPLQIFVVAHGVGMPAARDAMDLAPAAQVLKFLEEAGRPIALAGDYHGEYHFLGRLERPIAELQYAGVLGWLDSRPGAVIITRTRTLPATPTPPLYSQPMRGRIMAIWNRDTVLATPDAFGFKR